MRGSDESRTACLGVSFPLLPLLCFNLGVVVVADVCSSVAGDLELDGVHPGSYSYFFAESFLGGIFSGVSLKKEMENNYRLNSFRGEMTKQ
jgi:hypothetical protein